MAIKIEHEDIEELKKWGLGLETVMESCILCKAPTRFWSVASNCPVCECCAQVSDESAVQAPRKQIVPSDQ